MTKVELQIEKQSEYWFIDNNVVSPVVPGFR